MGQIVFLFALSIFTSQVDTQGWNGIYPLKSNRNDVERILGRCPDSNEYGCLYKLEKENVVIIYNTVAPCSDGVLRVAKGKVLSITVIPQDWRMLDDSGLDINRFSKEKISPTINAWEFRNHDEGVTIEAHNGFIKAIYFEPSKRMVERHKCK